MRFEDKTDQTTKIKIMTDGILLQEMKLDPWLSKYSVIMVDEAHERSLNIDLEDGLIHHLHFEGGCPGNLAAIGKLLEGRSAKEAADILLGNTCRDKQTSCADQLAHALIEAMKKGNQE